jgi:S1-C subfamily serine protease
MEEMPEIEAAAGGGAAVATTEDWRRALAAVVPAVVVLRTTAPRAFDTEQAGASYATGFVVDKKRGIILTNRHVVKPGNWKDKNFLLIPILREPHRRSTAAWFDMEIDY